MDKLKQLIKDSGLKQKFIAEKIDIDHTYLSAMLNGHREMPESTRNKIMSLCQRVIA